MDDQAHARRTDPWTSWAAANSIRVKPSQAAVLWLFSPGYATPRQDLWPHGCLTLEEIVEAVNDCAPAMRAPGFSESRLRTAAAELMQREPPLLQATGYTVKSRRGRQARLLGRAQPKPDDPNTPRLFA